MVIIIIKFNRFLLFKIVFLHMQANIGFGNRCVWWGGGGGGEG